MGKQIKLPEIDFAKIGDILADAGKAVGKYISNHTLVLEYK